VPELPELQALAEGLDGALRGRRVAGVRIHHPATIRAADPPLEALTGRAIEGVWRRGKIIGVAAEGDLTLVIHLMQAGRLGIASPAEGLRSPRTAALDLDVGRGEVLRLRELSTHRRASAHLLDAAGLAEHRPLARLGPEPIGLGPEGWRAALSGDGAVLHSALRDGRRVAGIGRAYASDIMWAARLAPFARAASLDDEEVARLAGAADAVLQQALERARERITTDLPNKEARVTAVHGHHGEPCLRCGTRLERVSFAEYELVYCPTCQTGGRVYRDRRMSRLLGAP
jgi:formamidopyrimidine-DNA glycosylase